MPYGYYPRFAQGNPRFGPVMKRKRVNNGDRSFKRRAAIPVRSRGYLRRSGYYGRYGSGTHVADSRELKFFDTTVDSFGQILATYELKSVNLIPQGVTESQRVGRKCTVSKIGVKGLFTMNGPVLQSGTSACVRFGILLDKQANGTLLNALQWVESNDIFSFNNLANKGRFKTLWSEVISMASPSGATATVWGENVQWFEKNINLKKPIPLEFDDTTGAITEIRSNNLVFFAVASAAATLSIAGTVRLRYVG